MNNSLPRLTAAEAATLIHNGQTVAFSGFTPAGAVKEIPTAIAARAAKARSDGQPFQIGVITGASTGHSLDGSLARADAILFRTPYQNDPDLRKAINEGNIKFHDMHLSQLPQVIRYGFLGPIHWAVVEACEATASGEIVLTSSVGATPTFCHKADKILIELNQFHPPALRGSHDIYEPADPPHRDPVPILFSSDRIGSPTIKIDPKKIVGVIETNKADETTSFDAPSETTIRIGENVADFLASELQRGLIPKSFLPLQSGVGDTANAVLKAMAGHREIPNFEMYTEVIQDAVIDLIKSGKIGFASGCSLSVSNDILREIYGNLEFFRPKFLLRPQEITNSPEVIRRLGVISINTALEADIMGNVNSTHVFGRNIMNGIGGSGDFARNAFLSIFICPSTAKNGKISTIVPLVSHLDSSEHSVQVIITEHGVADLRGKSPGERTKVLIEKCAHPDYRSLLRDYLKLASGSHCPQNLRAAFGMHLAYAEKGDMHAVEWNRLTRV